MNPLVPYRSASALELLPSMILLALGTFWDLRMSPVKFAAANGVWPYGYMF